MLIPYDLELKSTAGTGAAGAGKAGADHSGTGSGTATAGAQPERVPLGDMGQRGRGA